MGLAGSGATSGVALAHYELHAWCLLVLGWVIVPFYMRSRVYTMPEFLERRFSPDGARWVLSIISLVAYVLTKIAVGIFAGGVVFGDAAPRVCSSNLGGLELDSFWIGSSGGRDPDRALHRRSAACAPSPTPRRCRRSSWSSARPCSPSSASTSDRRLGRASAPRCGSDMFNLWKPLVPAGMEGTWAPVEGSAAGSPGTSTATIPWLGHAVLRADHRPLVLVHRPVHRPAHAGRAERARGAPRHASSPPS